VWVRPETACRCWYIFYKLLRQPLPKTLDTLLLFLNSFFSNPLLHVASLNSLLMIIIIILEGKCEAKGIHHISGSLMRWTRL
jgi:hypothetical protein